MTKSTITRERAQQIFLGNGPEQSASEERELARMTLVAMDSEPVAYIDKQWTLVYYVPPMSMGLKIGDKLYRHAQPVPELKPVGYLFISDQGAIVYSPTDWGMPGFRLVGQIYGDIDVESQPAPVVPEEATPDSIEILASARRRDRAVFQWDEDQRNAAADSWNACRAAMLQAGTLTNEGTIQAVNSPVIPDGYVMVPMRLTAENGAKGALSGEFSETKFVNCPECFGDDECETCDGSGRIEITVPVTWATIKEIWAKGVEHFAAAPQEVKP